MRNIDGKTVIMSQSAGETNICGPTQNSIDRLAEAIDRYANAVNRLVEQNAILLQTMAEQEEYDEEVATHYLDGSKIV